MLSLTHSRLHIEPMLLLLFSLSRYAPSWREKICFQYDKEISFYFLEKLPCAREGQEVSFKWNSEKEKESQNGINGKRENVYSKYMRNMHKFYNDDDVIWLLNWDNLFRKFIHCWRSSNREFISTLEIAEILIHCQRNFCFPFLNEK